MKINTCYFVNKEAAYTYYMAYCGYESESESKKVVDKKILDGEIKIGPPPMVVGDSLFLNEEGRYVLRSTRKNEQRIVGYFLQKLAENNICRGIAPVTTFSKDTAQVNICLSAMTRREWSTTVTIPKSVVADFAIMKDLANHFYNEIDNSQYTRDHEYWEDNPPTWDLDE